MVKCEKCGASGPNVDLFRINPDLSYPEEDHFMYHCICNHCGEEWVE